MIIPIAHDYCSMIIPKSAGTYKHTDKIKEQRALSCHMLGATRVHVPEDDLNDLKWIPKEDGEVETLYSQFLLGSELLEILDSTLLDLLLELTCFALGFPRFLLLDGVFLTTFARNGCLGGTTLVEVIIVKGYVFSSIVKVRPVGFDLLALVGHFTLVEVNKGLLVILEFSESACVCVLLVDFLDNEEGLDAHEFITWRNSKFKDHKKVDDTTKRALLYSWIEVGNNEGLMDEDISSDDDRDQTNSSIITKPKIKIGDEFLKILHDNYFNESLSGDAKKWMILESVEQGPLLWPSVEVE
uniref:Uncharacterized protein n=1 Tax=Tanacetum cinerariifolium TaxID=118510 RepID=A0A699HCW4_TANCI|nr:hypothetical protein [Tanacetum cinerariifolium]